jgi:hypothetical protein
MDDEIQDAIYEAERKQELRLEKIEFEIREIWYCLDMLNKTLSTAIETRVKK